MSRWLIIGFMLTTLWNLGCNAKHVEVTDDSIQKGQDVVWTADKTYVLNGLVFVDGGATLTIEPGTVIKAMPGQGYDASALVVARNGKIFAEGTADKPIIFTALEDDVDDPNDLPPHTSGLWGGIIILGNATVNTVVGMHHIEGIRATDPRAIYGGTDDDDNSGILRYVSIRYGGTDIGKGNEINGLTLSAVGRGTTIEFVEVFNNQDDGFEFFGGTVNTRYLVSAFNGDDAFDYDEGYRGRNQFWFSIQSSNRGDHALEMDGGTTLVDGKPYATPIIANGTFIGSSILAEGTENTHAVQVQDNAGGKLFHCIFTDFPVRAITIEDVDGRTDSRERLESGDLFIGHNLWYGFGLGQKPDQLLEHDFELTYISNPERHNYFVDPQLRASSREPVASLDPRPKLDSRAFDLPFMTAQDSTLAPTAYYGAFDRYNWALGWTALSQLGYFVDSASTANSDLISEEN